MKKSLINKSSLLIPAALLLLGSATSCNEKKEETEEIAVTLSTVAVKSFSLKADTKILTNLDSVFFSVDLNRGVIFNADSLPLGTDISRLIPVVTFTNTMSKAQIVVSEDGKEDRTFNYLENGNDSIDFTKKVALKVTAYDQQTEYTYDIKVNVHKQSPDSLMWDKMAVAKLPYIDSDPVSQRTLQYNDEILTYLEGENGRYYTYHCEDFNEGYTHGVSWFPSFNPDLSTLVAIENDLYMLDKEGHLYTTSGGKGWTDTGETWVTLIGPYMNSVLGVKQTDDGLIHCHYPANDLISDTEVEPDFPLSGRSELVQLSTKWAKEPTVFFVGGELPDMTFSDATWAFDGSVWAKIDDISGPAVKAPLLINYFNNRKLSDIFHPYDTEAWLLIGGEKADGTFNDTVYYSYDNGITWRPGSSLMQLPDYVPLLQGAQGLVISSELSANLNYYWTTTPSQKTGRWLTPAYTLDGYDISWECPYIYIIGGYGADGRLSTSIWRGVLTKLAFTPIF